MEDKKPHVKPTKEELQAGIDAALEEDPKDPPEDDPDAILDEDNSEDDLDPQADGEDEEEGEEDQPEDDEEEEPDEDEEEDKKPPTQPKKEEKPPVDYEKRYKDSSREAHILAESKKIIEQELEDAQNLPEPSEAELREEYPDWDDLSESMQKIAKKALHADKKEAKITEIREKAKADEERINARVKEIETFAIQPDILKKFPKLEGKQDDFIAYASKPTRLVMDLEDLAGLFTISLPEPKKNKGKMFEVGSGGPNGKAKPKGNKISVEQSEILRKTDFNKYREYLKSGRIDNTVE